MKKIKTYRYFYFLPLTCILSMGFLFSGCRHNTSPQDNRNSSQQVRESLLGANTMLIDAEDQEIKDFIARHGWEMKETGSGLRYMIYDHGEGAKAAKGKLAVFHYSLMLLTGDLVYSTREKGMSSFRIGRGGVESGLEEGMLLLRVGDRARFILPSHLAHGVPGDGVKIPKRATIIYDLELVDLQ